MKKSRNIKNLRDFPQNGMNCYLDNDLNKKNHQQMLQVIEFKQQFITA